MGICATQTWRQHRIASGRQLTLSIRQLEEAANDRRSAVRQLLITFVLSAGSGLAGIVVRLYGAVLVYNGSVYSDVVTALDGAIPTVFAVL
jgi:hypothetical protein